MGAVETNTGSWLLNSGGSLSNSRIFLLGMRGLQRRMGHAAAAVCLLRLQAAEDRVHPPSPLCAPAQGRLLSAEAQAAQILRYLEAHGYLQAPPCLTDSEGQEAAAEA